MRFLPPEALAKLGRCELFARGVVEGFITGKHKSPFKGFSVEFAEHRQYAPGDDLRNLDWRVLARKDRYYIKQYIEETNMRATLLLDASGSMGYAGDAAAPRDGRPLSKFAYAQHVAAMLGYLLIGQQDAAGLVTFDTALRTYLPARARASQVRGILEALERTEPGGETGLAGIFHDIAERIPRRGLVVILSDLFDDPDALINALHHFRYRRHEVLLFHLVAEEELTFPFDSYTKFRDLEQAGNLLPIDPRTIRATYLERMRRFLSDIETACGRLKIDYVRMNTRVPYDEALAAYLSGRPR
jgi:uncharacterized protein (DUF58 family)